MTDGAKIPCDVARDLLTPWLAGDVQPGTDAWLRQHLAECAECRAAADEARAQALHGVAPVRSSTEGSAMDADMEGRRLLARVRRRDLMLKGIIVLLLIAAIVATAWGVAAIRAWASMPVAQPVPAGDVEPRQAVAVDLSRLGLRAGDVITTEHGVAALWSDAGNNVVRVDMMRFANVDDARRWFNDWEHSYNVKIMSITMNTSLGRTAKFRSRGSFLYGWQTDRWFIAITVPNAVSDPVALRDGVRDALLESFTRDK
ncbi:MAG: zf-HC2 domain-containing protein [Chloroflexota bacterium]